MWYLGRDPRCIPSHQRHKCCRERISEICPAHPCHNQSLHYALASAGAASHHAHYPLPTGGSSRCNQQSLHSHLPSGASHCSRHWVSLYHKASSGRHLFLSFVTDHCLEMTQSDKIRSDLERAGLLGTLPSLYFFPVYVLKPVCQILEVTGK